METVIVTQIKSNIGIKKGQRLTLAALGLRKTGQQRKHTLTPQVQGMINDVQHLVRVDKA
ncbi:50S ribosomal protein L30 [Leptospira langatensis]|uniref:Large ribosomal subunit protein uL30 n=1 Tax=Leptospira langatensis TaxID=2484983 RepID=A0A5F1ZU18_9LEPT|nr:50S ribosomal protein L30 [Leptospira langatensis]TGJ98767.1 50S ribosomal protein L30 [Leptospira langatensis]TGL40666.1 50S ribosomal protein L30 [Leptospira langatensis]